MSAKAPRKRAQWRSVLLFDNFRDAKAALLVFGDEGAVKKPAWRALPGGEATRRTFRCVAHEDCPVMVRVAQHSSGVWELRREVSAVHSAVLNEKDRKNASLTRDEKEMMTLAREFGGTPATVLAKLQFTAVKNGTAHKVSGEDGEKSTLQGVHSSPPAWTPPASLNSQSTGCERASIHTFTLHNHS